MSKLSDKHKEIVKLAYPDATYTRNATGDRFMIISENWWPGVIGSGLTGGFAWKRAAETVQRQQEHRAVEETK